MQPMYPDTAQAYFCAFKENDKYCTSDNCIAWEEITNADGLGICSRLSRRRVIQSLSSRALEVAIVDLTGDPDETEAL